VYALQDRVTGTDRAMSRVQNLQKMLVFFFVELNNKVHELQSRKMEALEKKRQQERNIKENINADELGNVPNIDTAKKRRMGQ